MKHRHMLSLAAVLPALSIIGTFALFHGLAHGTEMPVVESTWLYAFGFMAASAVLHGSRGIDDRQTLTVSEVVHGGRTNT